MCQALGVQSRQSEIGTGQGALRLASHPWAQAHDQTRRHQPRTHPGRGGVGAEQGAGRHEPGDAPQEARLPEGRVDARGEGIEEHGVESETRRGPSEVREGLAPVPEPEIQASPTGQGNPLHPRRRVILKGRSQSLGHRALEGVRRGQRLTGVQVQGSLDHARVALEGDDFKGAARFVQGLQGRRQIPAQARAYIEEP